MSETIELTCIRCPLGCSLEVSFDANGAAQVVGNQCARGARYGAQEAENPRRTVCAFVCVSGCLEPLSVKTRGTVARDDVRRVARAIEGLEVRLPVSTGDVVCEDIAGTGVAVVATKDLA